MRGVIAAENLQRPVGQSFQNGLPVPGGTKRRIHFEIRVIGRPCGQGGAGELASKGFLAVSVPELLAAGNGCVSERKMMGASFAGDGYAPLFGLTQKADAACRADMLAVHMCP